MKQAARLVPEASSREKAPCSATHTLRSQHCSGPEKLRTGYPQNGNVVSIWHFPNAIRGSNCSTGSGRPWKRSGGTCLHSLDSQV